MTTSVASPWIFAARPSQQARVRLFCFSHAGGGASAFRTWSSLLPPEIEVCPVQLPGRENRIRETAFTRFSPLVESTVQALQPYLSLPFAFFGHSMGALVSFGLARELRRQHMVEPFHIFASAYRAPQIPMKETPIYMLPEHALIEKLVQLNGTKKEVLENLELRALLLPLLRADFSVCETFEYKVEEQLACPITAFGGLQDKRVHPHDLVAWREQTSRAFSLRMLPGGHFYWQDTPQPLLQNILPILQVMPVKS